VPDNSFDPRAAHLSGPTKGCGSGPESWAGSGDHPNTRAEPAAAAIFITPDRWLNLGEGYAELLIKRIDMTVVDFYRGNP